MKEEITILGVKMWNTVKISALAGWARLSSLVRTQARRAYSRDLNITQRITCVQVYLLSKLWYTAQVLQPPIECLRQIVSALDCLHTYTQEMAYIEPHKQGENPRTYRRRVYWTVRKMAERATLRM